MSRAKIPKRIYAAKGVIQRLCEALEVTTQTELAERLGVQQGNISQALSRNHVPEVWIYKVAYETGSREEWIRSGEEPQKIANDNYLPPSEAGIAKPLHSFVRETGPSYARTIIEQLASLDGAERVALERFLRGLQDAETRRHLIGQMQIIERALAKPKEERVDDQTA